MTRKRCPLQYRTSPHEHTRWYIPGMYVWFVHRSSPYHGHTTLNIKTLTEVHLKTASNSIIITPRGGYHSSTTTLSCYISLVLLFYCCALGPEPQPMAPLVGCWWSITELIACFGINRFENKPVHSATVYCIFLQGVGLKMMHVYSYELVPERTLRFGLRKKARWFYGVGESNLVRLFLARQEQTTD